MGLCPEWLGAVCSAVTSIAKAADKAAAAIPSHVELGAAYSLNSLHDSLEDELLKSAIKSELRTAEEKKLISDRYAMISGLLNSTSK